MVFSIDLRGFGETSFRGNKQRLMERNYVLYNLSLQLGRPILGQRVDDIILAANLLDQRKDVDSLHLVGKNEAGSIALHAAALDDRFQSVTLIDSLKTWTKTEPITLGNVIPDALKKYDLQDLAKRISPRKILWNDK